MKSNEKEEYYEYLQLTVYDEDGQYGWDVWLDQLLDDSMGDRSKENKIALENYFKEIFVKNDRGNWVNPKDKTDLVLIWWKKE